jgi:hypothetical protein
MLVMLIGALDQTIMAPALPAVAGDLGLFNQTPPLSPPIWRQRRW